jgi:hypothetical protein
VRRRAYLIVVIASLLIAACGASGGSSSSVAVTTTTRTSSPTPTSSSSSAATTSSSESASLLNITGGHDLGLFEVNEGSQSSSSTSAAAQAPNSDVRLPVTFAIGAGGSLAPPEIAVPKDIEIDLTVASKDGSSHTFALKTPHEYLATVRPGTPTRALLEGTPPGTYTVAVDDRAAGKLIIGVAPGP